MAPRTKAVPLTPEQLQLEKDIKRINERINEIAKQYGTESYAYNQWYTAFVKAFPEKFRRTSGSGVIQISRSKAFIQTANEERTKESVKRVLGLKTRGQLRKEARASLKQEGEKKIEPSMIVERMKAIDKINAYVEENSDMFYLKDEKAQEIIHLKERRKTYEELTFLADLIDDGGEVDRGELVKDPFEGLQ